MDQYMIFPYLSHMRKCANDSLMAHADISSEARGQKSGLSLHIHPYFMYGRSKTLASLGIWTDWPEPLLLTDAINTEISCTGQ